MTSAGRRSPMRVVVMNARDLGQPAELAELVAAVLDGEGAGDGADAGQREVAGGQLLDVGQLDADDVVGSDPMRQQYRREAVDVLVDLPPGPPSRDTVGDQGPVGRVDERGGVPPLGDPCGEQIVPRVEAPPALRDVGCRSVAAGGVSCHSLWRFPVGIGPVVLQLCHRLKRM